MARPKGSLNKRTRLALEKVKTGDLGEQGQTVVRQMLKIAKDTKKDFATRKAAADAALPYVCSKLSTIEQTIHDPRDDKSEDEYLARLQGLLAAKPELLDKLIELRDKARITPAQTTAAPEAPAPTESNETDPPVIH